jgi:uncharacterized membrane protein YfcA
MTYDFWAVSLRLGTGVVIGFLIALTGVGGGALAVPALTLVLGVPSSIAVGTASLYAFLTKCYAAFEHKRMGTLDMLASLTFLSGAIPANVAVAYFVNRYVQAAEAADLASLEQFQETLGALIGGTMLMSVVILAVNLMRTNPLGVEVPGSRPPDDPPSSGRLVARVASGVIVGALMGATSVGGGVLVLPALLMLFGLSASKSVGTSIIIALVLSLFTSVIYMSGGQIEYGTAVLMSIGSLAGVFGGSRLSARMPERPLQAIVIGVIAVAAMTMLF